RGRQEAFNAAHGIVPRGVVKEVRDLIDGVYDASAQRDERKAASATAEYEVMSEKQISKEIRRLEKLMFEHAKNLEFEKAARVRDQLALLKEQVFGGGSGNVVPIAPGARAA
ncbi:MAG TPA: UvrB/UvrC motif-containing protein, partial [Burkholderiaceae bacterium]|nr:UvrB/UvrC motif-containing protein [Burkholderiaceae bacterium]